MPSEYQVPFLKQFRDTKRSLLQWWLWFWGSGVLFLVGGFGIASDLSWSATAMLRYHFSERFSMSGGYRILDIDYEEGSGNRKFGYDANTSGPAIALAWQF